MIRGRIPTPPASASEAFSSTPVKRSQERRVHMPDECEDDGTFSLLSPIYCDSFDSDEELKPGLSPQSPARRSVSPLRCELLETQSRQMLHAAVEPAVSLSLSAWETWLVNKAKEDRLRLEKKNVEERLRKERKDQEEMELGQKKRIMEEKLREWLKMKREQERQEQLLKLSKKEEEIQRQQEKEREIQQRAQQKYGDWLHKKNQEKIEKQKKDKEKATMKEEQEKERRRMAEEKFKEWLAKANERSRSSPKSPCYPTSPYDKSYSPPSFYNPIPWKPIHVPPPETPLDQTPDRKPQKQRKSQPGSGSTFRFRTIASTAQLPQ